MCIVLCFTYESIVRNLTEEIKLVLHSFFFVHTTCDVCPWISIQYVQCQMCIMSLVFIYHLPDSYFGINYFTKPYSSYDPLSVNCTLRALPKFFCATLILVFSLWKQRNSFFSHSFLLYFYILSHSNSHRIT